MALSQRLEMRQGQQLVMTPQLQQAIRLLQYSNLELSQFVEAELERNPLLEREESSEPSGREEPARESADIEAGSDAGEDAGADEWLDLAKSNGEASAALDVERLRHDFGSVNMVVAAAARPICSRWISCWPVNTTTIAAAMKNASPAAIIRNS